MCVEDGFETELGHHAHGLTAFAWMLTPMAQPTLIRLRQRALPPRFTLAPG